MTQMTTITTSTGTDSDISNQQEPIGTRWSHIKALDGLRAVAVLAVMIFHFGSGFLSGGFLGVDLFFVLSGFLITSLLVVEWRRWGGIDMFAFWGRRIRRLMPALIVVTIFTLILAWAIDHPRGGSNGFDALASLVYLNNWNQVIDGSNYFDSFVGPSPFLHTWSLAIEEQFYLVWPPVLLVLLAKWRGKLSNVAVVVIGVVLLSAVLMAVRYSDANPTVAYVSTDTRLQTIGLGALIALFTAGAAGATAPTFFGRHRFLAQVVSLALIVALIIGFATVDGMDPWMYRGGYLLFAAISGLLIWVVVTAPSTAISRALSIRPAVAIGVISYGLYLWHWPMYVFLTPESTRLDGAALFATRTALTFAAAIGSYFAIERPIRRRAVRDRFGPRAETGVMVVGVLVAMAIAVTTLATRPAVAKDGMSVATSSNATFGATRTLLYGDSVTFAINKDFDEAAHPNIDPVASSWLGCPSLPLTQRIEGVDEPPRDYCQKWYSTWQQTMVQANPDVALMFAGQWLMFDTVKDGEVLAFGTPQWRDYMTAQWDAYIGPMTEQVPTVAIVNEPCYRLYAGGGSFHASILNDDQRIETMNQFLADYAAERGLPIVDFYDFRCGPGKDPEIIGGTKATDDGVHPTPEANQYIWDWLASEITRLSQTQDT